MKINSKIWSKGGVFTMIHMFIPHTPYRDESCSLTHYTGYNKERYKSSVYCSFKRIHELSDYIIKNYPNSTIVVQSDHGVYTKSIPKNKKFVDISESYIDKKLGNFTAVRGCNSNQASQLNQANIIEYIVECIVNGTVTKQFINKSFFELYQYQRVHSVNQKSVLN